MISHRNSASAPVQRRAAGAQKRSVSPIKCDCPFTVEHRGQHHVAKRHLAASGLWNTLSDAGIQHAFQSRLCKFDRKEPSWNLPCFRGMVLLRGLFCDQITGRIPVDVDVENSRRFPAEFRGSSTSPAGNRLVTRKQQVQTSLYAFSPTCNSADLKATPHE